MEPKKQLTEASERKAGTELRQLAERHSGRFPEADYMSGDFQNQITLDLKFTNETDKDIAGVQGILTLYDIFDNKISVITVSYDKGIPAHTSKVWASGIDYNEFIDEDVKLKNTELQNLKYKWEVNTIIYKDGSKETF